MKPNALRNRYTGIIAGCVALMSGSLLHAAQYRVTLEEAVAVALEHNARMQISKEGVQIAEALYDQALSARYPSLDLEVTAMRMDEAPTFEMRGTATTSAAVAQQQLLSNAQFMDAVTATENMATGSTTPLLAESTAQGMIAGGMVNSQTIPIALDVKVAGRDTVLGRLNLMLPLYTGGRIGALIRQADLNRNISREGVRRARNEVIYDVRRYYYAAMLTRHLKQLADDTYERMNFIQDLTSELYQGGSMSVKKTDYLRSRLTVNLIDSFREQIASAVTMADAALAFSMGLSWDDELSLAETDFKAPEMDVPLKKMVEAAYRENPDFKTLKLAVDVAGAGVDEAFSGYLPQAALFANAQSIYNDYDYGIINDTTKDSWTLGVGIKWSLFNGMRTTAEVERQRRERLKMQHQELLLKGALALQVREAFTQMESSYRRFGVLRDAVALAAENRDLNTRAYQEEMVETKDVIEAQLLETFTEGDFYRAQHDHALARARADYVIGTALEEARHE